MPGITFAIPNMPNRFWVEQRFSAALNENYEGSGDGFQSKREQQITAP
jgi:hypothetical protein